MMPGFFRNKFARALAAEQADRDLNAKIDARIDRVLRDKIGAVEHTEISVAGSLGRAITDRVEFKYASGGFVPSASVPVHLLHGEQWAAGPAMRDLMKTTAMPSWREIKSPPDEEAPMDFTVSMFELSLLAWRASHGNTPYPRGPGLGNPATVTSTLKKLEVKGLIKFGSEQNDYTLTPRAECLIEAMASLPLPVKQDPPWTMPGK